MSRIATSEQVVRSLQFYVGNVWQNTAYLLTLSNDMYLVLMGHNTKAISQFSPVNFFLCIVPCEL